VYTTRNLRTLPLVFSDREKQQIRVQNGILSLMKSIKAADKYSSKPVPSYIKYFLNKLLVNSKNAISKRRKKPSIGRGIEGFITFSTWARPPSISQLIRKLFNILDKLSHPGIRFSLETNNGK
jgi:hypothetical protein